MIDKSIGRMSIFGADSSGPDTRKQVAARYSPLQGLTLLVFGGNAGISHSPLTQTPIPFDFAIERSPSNGEGSHALIPQGAPTGAPLEPYRALIEL
jgi:hypothetical protein